LYVRSTLQWASWKFDADDRTFELHWVRIGNTYIGAIYHPPRPLYSVDFLLHYVESCVADILRQSPAASIILAGDLNLNRGGDRTSQPTRGPHILDRVFVSRPMLRTVRVVTSVLKSDHNKAVVAFAEHQRVANKTKTVKFHRKITPAQHAVFLQHIAVITLGDDEPIDSDMQTQFNKFYDFALDLLNTFYAEREITVTSRDPDMSLQVLKPCYAVKTA